MRTALLTIIHDPYGQHIDLFQKISKLLITSYSERFVTISDQTVPIWIDELKKFDFQIKIIPKRGAAHARREVLTFGLQGKADYFHYCDYDRLITWALKYPIELKQFATELPNYDYSILGRTKRAFATHPPEWQETEQISNRIFSLEFDRSVDIAAGSCSFSRRSAQKIANNSTAEMTDAEWPMIIHRLTPYSITYQEMDGLEYNDEINGIIADKSESERWLSRIKLCYQIAYSAIHTGKE